MTTHVAAATAPVAAEPEAPAGRLAASLTRLSLLAPPALFAVLGWQRRWLAEDGFITLRVAEQIQAGHGPIFNAGERVEASTSTLWTLLLAVVHSVVRIRFEVLAVGLGLALSVAGLVLAGAAAARLRPRGGRAVLPLGSLVVVALPPFWDFATSGLETGLVFGWLGASAYCLAAQATRPPGDGRGWPAAVLLGLGPLVRPDLALIAVPLLLALAAVRSGGGPGAVRRGAPLLAAGLAAPVAYQVFRMGYYAALVPNPGLSKEASRSQWGQGWRYLTDLTGRYALVVPAAVLAVVLAGAVVRRSRRGQWRPALALLAPAVGAALHALYVVRVGGDFMHARLLLPSVFAACLPVMVVPISRHFRRWAPVAVVAIWAVALTVVVRPRLGFGIPPSGIADERATWVSLAGAAHPVLEEDYRRTVFWQHGDLARRHLADGGRGLGIHLDPEPGLAYFPLVDGRDERVAIVAGNVGVLGSAAGRAVHVVDLLGLADALGARLEPRPGYRVGHQKRADLAWVWARFVAPPPPGSPAVAGAPPEAAVADARAALECGSLRRLITATSGPMSIGRFAHNLVDAVRLHGLRVDNDPSVARRELCG